MVRLKAFEWIEGKGVVDSFQFQSGAVKSMQQKAVKKLVKLFQFQSGAVKRRDLALIRKR